MDLREPEITELVKQYLFTHGCWKEEKSKTADLHQHGVDIRLVGAKDNGARFFIECKGKSHAKSEKARNSINKEGWLNALGQIVTRMNTKRILTSEKSCGQVNRAYNYGLGLYWVGAQVALRRIPRAIADVMNLHIFAVNDKKEVKHFTPSDFGKEHSDDEFN